MKSKLLVVLFVVTSFHLSAQKLRVDPSSYVKTQELPEYVIITSENTKLLGGIGITIDYKRSNYAEVLEELESLLQNRKKLRIRNQTDLLNAMSALGFEYVDAYNANAGTLGASTGNDVQVSGSQSKFRINMVFRKKEKNRQ